MHLIDTNIRIIFQYIDQ